jgi:hypothetical protein
MMLLYALGGIMQENNGDALEPLVIVRAWGNEPVRLYLYRIDNKGVTLVAKLQPLR